MSSVSSISSTNNSGADTSSALPVKSLGEGDFLKLLATQMSSQDPMNPMTDTSFIAQMAQFTALQQSTNMSGTMTQMNSSQQILQASSMIGRTVELNNGDGTTTVGPVDGVQIQAGTPSLIVNGQSYDLSQVTAIALTPTQP